MAILIRKTKKTLHFLEDKPTVYKAEQVSYPTVTSTMLIDEISQSRGVNEDQTKAVISALVNRIIHYNSVGLGVTVEGFGTFKPGIRAKCAKKIEDADASSVRQKVIHFFPHQKFTNMLNGLSIVAAGETLNDVV